MVSSWVAHGASWGLWGCFWGLLLGFSGRLEGFPGLLEPSGQPSWPLGAFLEGSGGVWGCLAAISERSWAAFGQSWGHLGGLLDILGGPLGPSWSLVGQSWGFLGGLLGRLGARSRASLALLGGLRPEKTIIRKSVKQLKIGRLEALSGARLEPCWGSFGAVLGRAGGFGGRRGEFLGRPRGPFGRLRALSGNLGAFRGALGHLGPLSRTALWLPEAPAWATQCGCVRSFSHAPRPEL